MRNVGILAVAVVLSACATTGATIGSGVGDRQLEHPPYYAGRAPQVDARVAHYPVAYQRGASQPALFDPSGEPESAVSSLLGDMNAFLDSTIGSAVVAATSGETLVPPNVQFGCETDGLEDCVERGDSVLGRRGTTMRLAVGRPSPPWIARNAVILDSVSASHALVITLEVGQYWTRQTGLRGAKSVELGTNHVVQLPWLTSLEAPVTVLQLTGAIVDREGKSVRIGAEGLLAIRSPLVASAVGAQRLVTDEDIEAVRTLRRSDIAGQPLVWREALCQLLLQLAGRRCA